MYLHLTWPAIFGCFVSVAIPMAIAAAVSRIPCCLKIDDFGLSRESLATPTSLPVVGEHVLWIVSKLLHSIARLRYAHTQLRRFLSP